MCGEGGEGEGREGEGEGGECRLVEHLENWLLSIQQTLSMRP